MRLTQHTSLYRDLPLTPLLPSPALTPGFRGQRIIEATVSTLVSNFSIGEGTRLLFGGCSAGARGALFTLDYVAPMLPNGVELRGFLDSPLWVDVEPLNKAIMPLQNETQAVVAMMNVTARLGTTCLAAYPAPDEQWKWCVRAIAWLCFALCADLPSLTA